MPAGSSREPSRDPKKLDSDRDRDSEKDETSREPRAATGHSGTQEEPECQSAGVPRLAGPQGACRERGRRATDPIHPISDTALANRKLSEKE